MGPSDNEDFMKWVLRNLSAVTRTEIFVKNLPRFVSDARKQFEDLVAVSGPSGTFDPFDVIYRTVYQLTMRTFGANEIAESPELLAKTLSLFQQIEKSSSPARIIFPWLPTAAHLRRMAIGARLYMIVNRIVDERRSTGRREDDALQYLLDNGNSIVRILGVSFSLLDSPFLHSRVLGPTSCLFTTSVSALAGSAKCCPVGSRMQKPYLFTIPIAFLHYETRKADQDVTPIHSSSPAPTLPAKSTVVSTAPP